MSSVGGMIERPIRVGSSGVSFQEVLVLNFGLARPLAHFFKLLTSRTTRRCVDRDTVVNKPQINYLL